MPPKKATSSKTPTKQKKSTAKGTTPKQMEMDIKTTRTAKAVKTTKPIKSHPSEKPLKQEKSMIHYEIELISLFAVTLLSIVALHTQAIGIVGVWIKGLYLSTLGFTGYVMPYFAFLLIFFSINKHFNDRKLRLLLGVSFFLLATLLFSSASYFDVISSKLEAGDILLYTQEGIRLSMAEGVMGNGGGILGNALTGFLIQYIGQFGTYLLATVLTALSVVLGFKVSLTRFIKDSSIQTAKHVKPVATKMIQKADMSLRGVTDSESYENRENTRPIEAYDSAHYLSDETEVTPFETSDQWEEDVLNRGPSIYDPYIDPVTGEYKDDLEDKASFEQVLYSSDYSIKGVVETEETDVLEMIQTADELLASADLSDPEDDTLGDVDLLNNEEFFGLEAFKINDSNSSEGDEDDSAYDEIDPLIASEQLVEVIEAIKHSDDGLFEEDLVESALLQPVDASQTKSWVSTYVPPKPLEITKEAPVVAPPPKPKKPYQLPPLSLLNPPVAKVSGGRDEIVENCKILETTMKNFGVDAKVVEVTKGPTITMYEILPSPGVKVSKIVNLSDDIALALAAQQVRIIAPIPGKSAVGIEIPNKVTTMVTAREVLESDEFKTTDSKISFALGKDISGKTLIADLAKMPHLLIAGSTGSGKSVCVNTIINSILFYASPDEVKLLMIDPKVVELSHYNGIPHLILPVVVDPKKAAAALNWAVLEMTSRYKAFADNMVKDINSFNRKAELNPELGLTKLPKIVILIDELADLMMAAPNQVEDAICRLAQMARAAGLHLIVATQRPSVDVITGLIKANIPSRIAFAVSSQIDSRTILDMAGAEKLLGKGDMLFYPLGSNKPQRVQGAFLSDAEVESIVNFIKNQSIEVTYQDDILTEAPETELSQEADEILNDAIQLVMDTQQASISMLQRRFRVGYNRAARLVDQMEERGIVGQSMGSKPREVLMTKLQWEELNKK